MEKKKKKIPNIFQPFSAAKILIFSLIKKKSMVSGPDTSLQISFDCCVSSPALEDIQSCPARLGDLLEAWPDLCAPYPQV